MKFKPGDLLVYITDSKPSRMVVDARTDSYLVRNCETSRAEAYLGIEYVEAYYQKATKLHRLLNEIDDEV